MHIVLTEPLGITEGALRDFSAPLLAAGHEFTYYPDKASDDVILAERLKDADVALIANRPLPESVLKQCEKLRYIDVAFTGYDHVAMDYCREKNILVSNAAGYSDQTVAEITLGFALSLLRKLPECNLTVRRGGTSAALRGREIAGRTVGVIGLGRIGRRTAQLFSAFGAHVIACDPVASADYPMVTLEELLKTSDIVTLHAPNIPATRRMLGAKQFALMQPHALFINCARGALVDSQALADALNRGLIAGAAVDVFDAEPPLPADEPLLQAKNCILAPHVAYLSDESMLRRAQIVFDNLNAYLAGHPQNLCR